MSSLSPNIAISSHPNKYRSLNSNPSSIPIPQSVLQKLQPHLKPAPTHTQTQSSPNLHLYLGQAAPPPRSKVVSSLSMSNTSYNNFRSTFSLHKNNYDPFAYKNKYKSQAQQLMELHNDYGSVGGVRAWSQFGDKGPDGGDKDKFKYKDNDRLSGMDKNIGLPKIKISYVSQQNSHEQLQNTDKTQQKPLNTPPNPKQSAPQKPHHPHTHPQKQQNSITLTRSKLSNLNNSSKLILIDQKLIQQLKNSFALKPNSMIIHAYHSNYNNKNAKGKKTVQFASNLQEREKIKGKFRGLGDAGQIVRVLRDKDRVKQDQISKIKSQKVVFFKGQLKGWGQIQSQGLTTFYQAMASSSNNK